LSDDGSAGAVTGTLVPEDLAIDLRQLVMTIAHAVDLVGVDDVLHGRRVGMLSRELALRLGWDEAVQLVLYDAGLLHDCGVSSTRVHRRLAAGLEWEGAEEHCIRGEELLAGFAPLAHLAPVVRHHHSRWERLERQGVPLETARLANVVFLADRADVLAAHGRADDGVGARRGAIRARLSAEQGRLFSAELLDAFAGLSEDDSFWLGLQPDRVQRYQLAMEAHGELRLIGWQDFKRCAEIFAAIIDAKSPYTEQHSRGVARLSRHLAGRLGLAAATCEKIEVAGMLHDIGKLQVPDEIIEGQGPLSDRERDVMRKHSRGTLEVLSRLPAIDEIARWAAYHHETPDGHGYPFRLQGAALPLEARIINVADIFQALAQDRPYRRAMAPAEILTLLEERAAEGRADAAVVAAVAADLESCHGVAVSSAPAHSPSFDPALPP
jgi:putative nucleotidyltransferase with HDIG domain